MTQVLEIRIEILKNDIEDSGISDKSKLMNCYLLVPTSVKCNDINDKNESDIVFNHIFVPLSGTIAKNEDIEQFIFQLPYVYSFNYNINNCVFRAECSDSFKLSQTHLNCTIYWRQVPFAQVLENLSEFVE